MKLAIVDLDGVVADNTKRFEKAEEAKQAFMNDTLAYFGGPASSHEKDATNLYWRTAFTPELVALDMLIEGAYSALDKLMHDGYQLIYLTSRPESMREATMTWLMDQGISNYANGGNIDWIEVFMKPPAFQYTKTIVWKVGIIQMLVNFYGADEVLVVDDEGANLAELQKYDVSHMRLCSSLVEAIAPPEQAEESPF